MSEPAKSFSKRATEKMKGMLKPELKLLSGSLDQMRQQFAKLGLELPQHGFVEKEELTWKEKISNLWHDLVVSPTKWLIGTMMFKIVLVFFGTFVTAGLGVYFFEHINGNKDQFVNVWDGIWWGIVTITTTGYGDKYPATFGGRIIAGTTMCIGIVTAGIVTGNIASWLVDRRLKEGRGLINLAGKTGHLVICGWRREMGTVLDEIFSINPLLKPSDVVIIAPIDQETLETFKADERYARVNILRGDYYNPMMLEHASIRLASKVLVLSDWSRPDTSVTEADAKTVMTCMTIEKIAPQVYVAAEIIDVKFESYLKIAHVDEVIHSKEYARILLANSAKSSGIAHIVYDLLNVETPSHLTSKAIPKEYIGKTFHELAAHFRKSESAIIIGVLENTGNLHVMKKEALADAQKNPDTRTVLRNLKEVKNLSTNLPVLTPPKDYIIKKNSHAVIVANRHTKERYLKGVKS